jgi:hypothetical protein
MAKGPKIDVATYFLAKRMERVGKLRPGQPLILAATLPNTKKSSKKGKRK